ncbi:MAG: ROK family protein [Oligoflexales bacterium]|nr:ROK family protein [Oligoflexales bacterium]
MKNYLVFDMGGSAVKWGVLDSSGSIRRQGSFPTPTDYLPDLYSGMKQCRQQVEGDIDGIALSCPGAVDSEKGTIGGCSAIPCIHGPNLKLDLEEKFQVRVELENDANCAALAELWLGEAKNNRDVIVMVLGTGVGGAIVKDRKIHRGKNLRAGELGLMYFEWETGVTPAWGRAVAPGYLVDRASEKLGYKVDGIELFRLAEKRLEPVAVDEVERWYQNMAKGILTIQYFFDPEKIIIGGGVSAKPGLIPMLRQAVIALAEKFPKPPVIPELCKCRFDNSANLVGALCHFLMKECDGSLPSFSFE